MNPTKPSKPHPDFPLGPASCGKWCKKIGGRIYYFGCWARRVNGVLVAIEGDTSRDALKEYDERFGNGPQPEQTTVLVKHVLEDFRKFKLAQVANGELAQRSYTELVQTMDRLYERWGQRPVESLKPLDFAALRADLQKGRRKRWGLIRLKNEIGRVLYIFKFGEENVDNCPRAKFGTMFKKPTKAKIEDHLNGRGDRMMTPEQIRTLIQEASVPLRAMILLGINCGLGNHDCSALTLARLDLDKGWLDFPRPKTAAQRKSKLWPETVAALRAVIGVRTDGLVFQTSRGNPLIRVHETSRGDSISRFFKDLLRKTGLYRAGLSFYTLRSIFRTVADSVLDLTAIRLVMGHKDPGIDRFYRQRIGDERLVKVAEHVREWLFAE